MGHMSGGYLAALCIGLLFIVLLIVLLVYLFIRFRHHRIRRKHSKLSCLVTDDISFRAPNQFYSNETEQQRKPSTESWASDQYGMTSTQTVQFDNSWLRSQPYSLQSSLAHPTKPSSGDANSFVGKVSAAGVCHVRQVQADAPSSFGNRQLLHHAVPGAYHLGDLSMANTNAFSEYPNFSRQAQSVANTSGSQRTSVTDSRGDRSSQRSGKSARLSLRSKVRSIAHTSQLRFQNLRSSKQSGSNRRRKSRKWRISGMGGSSESQVDNSQFNANKMENPSSHEDIGSLDNDTFLCSLELAAFSVPLTPSQGTLCYHPAVSSTTENMRNQRFPNDSSLAFSDLGLGMSGQRASEAKKYAPIPKFRFPTPGPPVSGWAHKFARMSKEISEIQQNELCVNSTMKHTTSAKKVNSKSDSVPLIPPPASGHLSRRRFSRRKCSTESSLPSVHLYDGSNSTLGRQHSEPGNLRCSKTKLSEYGLNSLLAGSLSTLESVMEPAVGRPKIPKSGLDVPLDSGYQDSLPGTSLEYSARSVETNTLSLDHSLIHSTGSPLNKLDDGTSVEINVRKMQQYPTSDQKPKLISLCNLQTQRGQSSTIE